MAITAQELNVILSARDKQFTKAMDRASNRVARFASKSRKDLGKTSRAFNSLGSVAARLGAILAAAFSVQTARNANDFAVQIGRLSQLAGVGTTDFQKFAVAAKTVGVEQEKAADILKDVNDKVGDFLITGAGPLADFFETIAPLVGVTADNFRDLNSADALQLYVDTLQKANVSQAQMTFFLEAIASDATALMPLLKDSGKAFKTLGEEAAKAGRVMDKETIAKATALQNKLDALKDTINVSVITSLHDLEAELVVLSNFVTDYGAPALSKLVEGAAFAASAIDFLAKGYKSFTGQEGGLPSVTEKDVSNLEAEIDKLIARRAKRQKRLQSIVGEGSDRIPVDQLSDKDQKRVDALLQDIQTINTELSTARFALAEMKKELNLPTGNTPLTVEVDEGTVTGDPPPTTNTGPPILTEEQRQAIRDARVALEELRGSLDPLLAAQDEYNDALKVMEEFEQLTGEKIADKSVIIGQLEASLQRAKDEMSGMADVADTLEDGLTSVFMAAVEGSKSFEDSMRQTAAAVIKELYRVLVVQQLVNAAMGAFGFSPVPGGGFTRTGAGGRQMQAGVPYMTGESGRELFVPSTPGRLLSPSQTNNAMGAGGGVVVNQTINLSTGVSQTVRAEVQGMLPRITEATKAAVADAARRGGPYAKAFT